MNNRQASIMTQGGLSTTIGILEKVNTVLKGFGMIVGGVAASLADWIMGSISLGILFVTVTFPFANWVFAVIWSLGSWGVQLMLWEMIFSGKIKNAWVGNWGQRTVIIMVILMKICDDVTDLMAIFVLVQNSPMQEILGKLYNPFLVIIFLMSYIMVGFSEMFVSMALVSFKHNKEYSSPQGSRPNPVSSYNHPGQRSQPRPLPGTRPSHYHPVGTDAGE